MPKAFTDTVMMVRPASFGYNAQTAVSNKFQTQTDEKSEDVIEKARHEFDGFVAQLKSAGIQVEVIEDTAEPAKPDAVFPNNWISFHESGEIVTYPMRTRNRRVEYRPDIVKHFVDKFGFKSEVELGHYTQAQIYLEGTGSMVLDRENKVCYACLSPRTDERLLIEFCKLMDYEMVVFDALDPNGKEIYHTNVMMALGPDYAVLCAEAIEDEDERDEVLEKLSSTGKAIINISFDQLKAYAGNMLHLQIGSEKDVIVCSAQAWSTLTDQQRGELEKRGQMVLGDIETIETMGGGSVRCMLAEVFCP